MNDGRLGYGCASFETAAEPVLGPAEGRTRGRLPCICGSSRRQGRVGAAVADGSPELPRVNKPVPEQGAPSVVFVSPNSRWGRAASPHAQGREMMAEVFVGIDVSKDRLDVQVRPLAEACYIFAVAKCGRSGASPR